MSKYLSKIFLLLFALILSSCVKEKNYPAQPVIKFKSFTHSGRDSANVIITFTDGDGDIGLNQEDTTGDFSPKSKYYNNFHMRYFYKSADGSFKVFETAPGDTVEFNYRIPKLLKDGQQRKALSGEIKVKMGQLFSYPLHDTIQYEIYIYDKSLHKSNTVKTGEIILN